MAIRVAIGVSVVYWAILGLSRLHVAINSQSLRTKIKLNSPASSSHEQAHRHRNP
jgi:hypothetical protein